MVVAILAAILDFSVIENISVLDLYKFEFSDLLNLFKDTKIIIISALEAKIQLIICCGGHFGGHLG